MTSSIWAVVPIKETAAAKQRLANCLSPSARRQLALTMIEDVLEALCQSRRLAGILTVTVDPVAAELSRKYGAQTSEAGALGGHTGAVTTAAEQLASNGHGMLAIPGDIPLLCPQSIDDVLEAHGSAPAFTIVPARDLQGSNCIVMSPANVVPLRFGENSFYPHLAAAERAGITPRVVRCPSIELDVDTPTDLAELQRTQGVTRTHLLLAQWSGGGQGQMGTSYESGAWSDLNSAKSP
jgi:2-phospho-L-lactate/phosphoenolpyruvate guanylyltransferase